MHIQIDANIAAISTGVISAEGILNAEEPIRATMHGGFRIQTFS
jgi:hypothetical protein